MKTQQLSGAVRGKTYPSTTKEISEIPAIAFLMRPDGSKLYVADKPSLLTAGGGSTWKFTQDRDKARALNPFWQKRFVAHCNQEPGFAWDFIPCPELVPVEPRKAWHS